MSAAGIGLAAAINAPARKPRRGEHEIEVTIGGLTVAVTFEAEYQPAERDIGVSGGYALTDIVSAHLVDSDKDQDVDVSSWIDRLQPQIDEAIDEELAAMSADE